MSLENLSYEDIASYLYEIRDLPEAQSIAKALGLQVVKRGKKIYYRRIPKRLTGKALESALVFGATSKETGGVASGKKALYNGKVLPINVVALSEAIRGNRYVPPSDEPSEVIAKIKRLLQTS